MNNFKYLIYFLLVIFTLFHCKMSYSDEVYVYCADKEKNWKWLKYGKERVRISGQWIDMRKKLFNNSTLSTKYFAIDGYKEDILKLRELCVIQQGINYQFIQAANSYFTHWYPIGISNKEVAPGFFEITKFPSNFLHRGVYQLTSKLLIENEWNNIDSYFYGN